MSKRGAEVFSHLSSRALLQRRHWACTVYNRYRYLSDKIYCFIKGDWLTIHTDEKEYSRKWRPYKSNRAA